MLDQLVEDGCNRPQHTGWQGLRLVEHQDAASQVVQLAQMGRAVREQGFEQLHRRGDDQWRVPVLARHPGSCSLCLWSGTERAMMLEDGV